MRPIIWFTILLVASACSSGNKPPEGYIEACYGGDFSKNLSGAKPIYSAVLDLDQPQWIKLSEVLKLASERHGLRYFNDTRNTESLKMISVSLCSENGLFLNADKRIWHFDGKDQQSPPLMVNIFAYRNSEKWSSFAKEVDQLLRQQWPQQLKNNPNIETRLMTSPL